MELAKDYFREKWEGRLGELWPKLDALLEFFGPHSFLQITNLLCLAATPDSTISMIEACRELVEYEERVEQPAPDADASKRRTTRMTQLIRRAAGAG